MDKKTYEALKRIMKDYYNEKFTDIAQAEKDGKQVEAWIDEVSEDYEDDIKELNIVTCGNCGRVFAHELTQENELTCPYCKLCDDISNFPDLYYPPKWKDSIINIIK